MIVSDTETYIPAAGNDRSLPAADRRHVGLREAARVERFWTIRDAADQLFNQRGCAPIRPASASEGRFVLPTHLTGGTIRRTPPLRRRPDRDIACHHPALVRPGIQQLDFTGA